MIADRFVGLHPTRQGSFGGRLRVRAGRCRPARRRTAADSLAEEACLPWVENAAWDWRQKAWFLALVLVIASMNWILAQGAAAFLQALNHPVSRGSEWEALASRDVPIPTFPFNWQFH